MVEKKTVFPKTRNIGFLELILSDDASTTVITNVISRYLNIEAVIRLPPYKKSTNKPSS